MEARVVWQFILGSFLAVSLVACGQNRADLASPQGSREETMGEFQEEASEGFSNSKEQAVGYYWSGMLKNAVNIGDMGPGYQKLFVSRNSGWTTIDMVRILSYAADDVARNYPNRSLLQLGDLSSHHGGTLAGHASHQNGLDVDIKYFPMNDQLQAPQTQHGFNEKFVANGRLSNNFDIRRNWHLIQNLVETNRVNRIFMDPVIKHAFCQYTAHNRTPDVVEALHHLQPLANHRDHMHMRLTCPPSSPHCMVQGPTAPGDGCNDAKMGVTGFELAISEID